MNIKNSPEPYKKQIALFLRDYEEEGSELAKRYLHLVTSEAYRSKRGGAKKTGIPVHNYLTSDRAKQPVGARKREQISARKRELILSCVASNPGISIEDISCKTGIKKAVTRQHTRLLVKENYIREEAEGQEVKEDKIYFIKGNANDYRNR
jgi:predicted transcriptional regulator